MRRLAIAVVTVGFVLVGALPALAGSGEDVLRPGEQLGPGEALLAPGGAQVLVMQPDGSLGMYALDDVVRWTTGRGVAGSVLSADATGDVRLVAPDGAVVWSTGTGGSGGTLRLQDDGDLVVQGADGAVVWSSGTSQAPSSLTGPGRLVGDDVLSSPDGRHTLLIGPDGVQLMGPDGAVRWAPQAPVGPEESDASSSGRSQRAGTSATPRPSPSAAPRAPAVALELREDGNLVALDADGAPVWRSRTAGHGPATLTLQDDGNLVLLDAAGAPVWSSSTPIGPSALEPGGEVAADGLLGSPSGHLGLAVRDGALVASWDGEPFWSSPTDGAASVRLQEDGDLVLLDAAGTPVWSTGTAGRTGARLVLEERAVLLLTPDGEVPWQVPVPEDLAAVPVDTAPAPRAQPTECALVDGPVAEADVVRTGSGIRVHPCLADAVDALVTAARDAGVELGGGGWRSPEQQIALRRAHCGPSDADIYDKPASACSPSTARPGSSRHERGLAIDFTSGGRSLSAGSPAYAWLVQNAAAYGLSNLPGEPWHWSVDGS
ncbi:D-alanyl-D-alanine carboxypeptidase family protein [Cellulomonas sp. zg-ZUI199]|uniref:D-alanyl-D-alanine carboxypeptidase family protein n=1 Tax=Cellulomonas wangleii TaxID=2816956 RepID=A0ABX8D0V0_9CELL|nr:D-alanyl-D-alanine carboxypeptidase family protein [Cellulomonas wangleii]MBO0925399.1 D-alanyl-D-alanine carboxypeptidase family protein [Cellulomonas wangleii]QVI61116.1 D-alanyl-D-alanine carboxypeptidase family protein [Cellulomonas wangleii]